MYCIRVTEYLKEKAQTFLTLQSVVQGVLGPILVAFAS